MPKEHKQLFAKLTNKIGDLIPFPASVNELIMITNNPNVSSREIAVVIEKDQAMTSRVLRLANSASYGFARRIKTISHAIVCLGFAKVKSLVLTVTTNEMLGKALEKYSMQEGALFKHSLAVAIGASVIAEVMKIKGREEFYIMGLLHDIGKLIINQNAETQMDDVWKIYQRGGMKFYQAEQEALGFDHSDVGAEVARKWNFANDLCNVIGYHHSPFSTPGDYRNTCIVNMADGIAKTIELCQGMATQQKLSQEIDGIFSEKTLSTLGMTKAEVLKSREIIVQRTTIVLQEFSDKSNEAVMSKAC